MHKHSKKYIERHRSLASSMTGFGLSLTQLANCESEINGSLAKALSQMGLCVDRLSSLYTEQASKPDPNPNPNPKPYPNPSPNPKPTPSPHPRPHPSPNPNHPHPNPNEQASKENEAFEEPMRDYIRMLAQCKQVRGRGRARGVGLGLGLGLVNL